MVVAKVQLGPDGDRQVPVIHGGFRGLVAGRGLFLSGMGVWCCVGGPGGSSGFFVDDRCIGVDLDLSFGLDLAFHRDFSFNRDVTAGADVTQPTPEFPVIRTGGVDGLLVSFGDRLSEPANRAALAFRAAVEGEGWEGVEETSSTLVSCFVRFDPLRLPHEVLRAKVDRLLKGRSWFDAVLPGGRRFWRIPTVYGTDLAPQLSQAAAAAGMREDAAVASLSGARVRVQALGFAPGQPYLGELPQAWDIPRQSQLSKPVAQGALVVAIRQLVLFGVSAPTGWQHVGQRAITLFQPGADEPVLLRPGDEVQFIATDAASLENMRRDPNGGATFERIT